MIFSFVQSFSIWDLATRLEILYEVLMILLRLYIY